MTSEAFGSAWKVTVHDQANVTYWFLDVLQQIPCYSFRYYLPSYIGLYIALHPPASYDIQSSRLTTNSTFGYLATRQEMKRLLDYTCTDGKLQRDKNGFKG
jgi:hypothetical protein